MDGDGADCELVSAKDALFTVSVLHFIPISARRATHGNVVSGSLDFFRLPHGSGVLGIGIVLGGSRVY